VITVLAVHFAVAAVAPFIFRKFRRSSFYALAAVPAGSFVWLLLQYGAVYGPAAESAGAGPGQLAEVIPWIPGLGMEFAFRMDALAWVMSLLVLGVGALVLLYCARYFKNKDSYLGGFGAQLMA
jgi:multicomponent Na+:H+ antiporter subunit A